MRRRLAVLVAATTVLVLVAFLVPLALLVRNVAEDQAVSEATREAETVAPLVTTVDRHALELAVQQAAHDDSADYPLTVFFPDGTQVGADAPVSSAVRLAQQGRSVTAVSNGGREILVAVEGAPGGTVVVRTFVSAGQLHHGVARTWLILGLLGVCLLALSLIVADRLARTIVRPIDGLAAVTRRLARGEARTRADTGAGPREVRDVARGLNMLADRIGELLAAEREHVADLSHQLRTPLTALKLNAESVRDPEDRGRVTDSVDAVENTVNRVIEEARRPVREGLAAGCDAVAVTRDRVEFWSALAEEEVRAVAVDLPESPIPVRASTEDLGAAVDALLGNIFAHTPAGTALAVRLALRSGGGAELTVADEGPGMPAGDMLARGSGEGSTGLGLDIARRTARSSGGDVRVARATSGGTEVVMELGAHESLNRG